MSSIFDQFKGMAETEWCGHERGELEKKGWVVYQDEFSPDWAKTGSNVADLLQAHPDLFKLPSFVPYLKKVFSKLEYAGSWVTAAARKVSYLNLIQGDFTALPLQSRLFLLEKALELKNIPVVMKLFEGLPATNEVKDRLNAYASMKSLQEFMLHLVVQDQGDNFDIIFNAVHALDLYGRHCEVEKYKINEEAFYSNILSSNPFHATQQGLAQSLAGKEYSQEIVKEDEWERVVLTLKHKNRFYKIEITPPFTEDSVREWIDAGLPTRSRYHWKPTVEQFGEMLKSGQFDTFNRYVSWNLQESGYLALVVNRCAITNEQLKAYYLSTKEDHFQKHEMEFIFARIGTMDFEMAAHFFAAGINFTSTQAVLKAFPRLISHFNHQKQAVNLPLTHIRGQNWEFAKLVLQAGWNPLKSQDGAKAVEETLLMMMECLGNMSEFGSGRKYKEEDLPLLRELVTALLAFIPENPHAPPLDSDYAIAGLKEQFCLEYEIASHLIRHGKHTDPLTWLKDKSDFPDLVLFLATQHRERYELHHHLCHYLGKSGQIYLRAAKHLIRLGCPVGRKPSYFSEYQNKQKYRDPAKIFLKTLRECKKGEKLEISSCLQLLDSLVPPGFDFNRALDTKRKGIATLTYFEKFYLQQSLPRPFIFDVMELLIKRGGEVTPRMARRMKLELKACPHEGLMECLKQGGHIEAWEMADKPADLLVQAGKAIEWLEKEAAKPYLLTSLVEFGRIRQLKKEIKADPSLKVFEKLSTLYDAAVSRHLLLRELRDISRQLRNGSFDIKKDLRTIRLYSLWSPDPSYDFELSSQRVNCLQGATRKVFWDDIVGRIFKANDATIGANLFNRGQIVWFHGTKLSSIPSIKRDNGLAPMGELYAQGKASFAGELAGSHTHHNKEQVSGQTLTPSWAVKAEEIFGASTRFLVSYLYAAKNSGYGQNEKYFDPEKAWARVTDIKGCLEESKKRANFLSSDQNYSPLMADIMRLRLSCPDADERLKGCRAYIEERLEHTPDLKELHNALNVKVAYTLTPEELKFVQRREPVVFASLTIDSTRFADKEFVAKGKQTLGKDIQIAFTEEGIVEEVQGLLKDTGVQVFPFEVAFYLETMQMITGSLHEKIKDEPLTTRIGAALKWDILPRYAIPYPEPAAGRHVAPGCKTHQEYLAKVKEGIVLPRTIHGKAHAARVALWTLVLYKLKGNIKGEDPYLAAIAAACHDIARVDEDKDDTDTQSALFLKSYLQARGYKSEEIAPYVKAVADKDPPDGKYTSYAQMFVHDADVLEIIRCLENSADFRASELKFPILKDKLIREIFSFIKKTEVNAVKWHLETQSEDPFAELIQMINATEYPMLDSLLS